MVTRRQRLEFHQVRSFVVQDKQWFVGHFEDCYRPVLWTEVVVFDVVYRFVEEVHQQCRNNPPMGDGEDCLSSMLVAEFCVEVEYPFLRRCEAFPSIGREVLEHRRSF